MLASRVVPNKMADRTLIELESACRRLISENESLLKVCKVQKKALVAVKEWSEKPPDKGGDFGAFAEEVIPEVYAAIELSKDVK